MCELYCIEPVNSNIKKVAKVAPMVKSCKKSAFCFDVTDLLKASITSSKFSMVYLSADYKPWIPVRYVTAYYFYTFNPR